MLKPSSLSRKHVLDVLSYILECVRKKKPMSLIRLGDGEGRFLGYPEFVRKEGSGDKVLDHSLRIGLGRTDFLESELHMLSLQIRNAVKDADIIGLPRVEQCNKHIAYQYVFDAINRFELLNTSQILCDAAIHRYLQFGLFYRNILQNKRFVGLITGRSDLGLIIKKNFNIGFVKSYLIPAEAIHPGGLEGEHFPDRYNSLRNELKIPFRGAVFLVGAGYLGKIYCHWIKEKGGIAIDIGSICDSWVNKGRLQNDIHKVKRYAVLSDVSIKDQVELYNRACHYFSINAVNLTNKEIISFNDD